MRILLLPISFLYHIVLAIRHKLYDWHILKTTRFEKPVICVGNLNLGGTGKTPHTEYLIRLLQYNYRVATLSRGYGRKSRGFKMAETASTYEDLGDEPLQYFKKYPEIQVAVDEDRVDGVTHLFGEQGIEVVLLDDAFQHRNISAGLNILLTEYQHLYTSKSPKELDEEEKKRVINRLKTNQEQKVYFSYLQYDPLLPLNEMAKTVVTETADSVMTFCGIANPKPFVEALGKRYNVIDSLCFADHHAYTDNDIKEILKNFEGLGGTKKIIVTTEKDAARLTNSPYLCQFDNVPLYDLPVNVRFHEEEKFNEEILNYVRKNAHHG